jgi:hypothetical protein
MPNHCSGRDDESDYGTQSERAVRQQTRIGDTGSDGQKDVRELGHFHSRDTVETHTRKIRFAGARTGMSVARYVLPKEVQHAKREDPLRGNRVIELSRLGRL